MQSKKKMTRRRHHYKGLLISFVGGEGSGKGVQRKNLSDYLDAQGFVTITCVDPHDIYRDILLNPKRKKLCPKTELFIFMAGRAEVVEETVKPALEKGKIVLYEQYIDASKAYQGYGLQLPLKVIDFFNNFATDKIKPDLTFLLDVEPRTAKVAIDEFGTKDKIESRPLDFHKRVREGYLKIASEEPERFRVIPYVEGNPEIMQQQIRNEVNKYIDENKLREELLRQSK